LIEVFEMSNVLCIYYSRTGHTKQAMEEIAQALDAELVEITDGMDRSGALGAFRCGLDAMRRNTKPLRSFETRQSMKKYRLVILGTPVWAGRCSSVARDFLKRYGKDLQNVAYVITRGSEDKNEEVYDQMDQYTPDGHRAAVSLRVGAVGHVFWQEEFLRQVRDFLGRK